MQRVSLPLAGCLVFAASSLTQANLLTFNIDFGVQWGTPAPSFGAAASQSGFWEAITATGTTSNLTDTGGATTSVSLTLSADDPSGNDGDGSTDARKLTDDNFYSGSGNSWSISMANLSDGEYDVYLYAPTHSGVNTGTFTVNGSPVASMPGQDSDTLGPQGTDWDVVGGVSVSGGSLTIESTSTSSFRGLAGLQLAGGGSPIPEPNSVALFGVGLGAIALRRRKRERT